MKQHPKRLRFTRTYYTVYELLRLTRAHLRVFNRDLMTAPLDQLTLKQQAKRARRQARIDQRNQEANRRRDQLIERLQQTAPRVMMTTDPATGKPRGVMILQHPDGPIQQPLHELPGE